MTKQLFPRLFEPGSIGGLRLKNRIVMLPMGTAYASPGGEVTQKTIDYYVARAKGGAGLITVGNLSPFLPNALNQLVLDSDWVLIGHYELVEKIHACGVKITAQINHMGRQKYPVAHQIGEQLVSSSALSATQLGEVFPMPKALSKGEIYQVIERYASAAERAKRVGYDMVELHGAHGYLINQFISPFMNKRTDEFGGSLENRMRFPLELIKALRQAVGPGFPIGFRLSAEEFVPGGITLEESVIIARMLEAAGVAYISVTGSVFETTDKMEDLMRDPEGWKEYLWQGIKNAVSKVPILAGGGMRHPQFCEGVLERGHADFIGLARPLLADPDWPNKAKEGQVGDIRLCISCNECIFGSRRRRNGARRCTVNAATGREGDFARLTPAARPKKVIVIGGGPAGMEAARIAAMRGHSVTLYERNRELGGQLLLAGSPESKKKVLWLRDYLTTQLKKLRVKVELGTEVTSGLLAKANPDAVIVATGAEPILPDIPGIRGGNVATAWDILGEKVKPEKENIAVVGGGMVGCEVAEFLMDMGNRVTIIEQLPAIAADMEPINRVGVLRVFDEKNVPRLTGRKVTGITEKGVRLVNATSGQEEMIEAERVVIAAGSKPVDNLAMALEGNVPELFAAGDCNRPRVIMEAIYEGSLAGRQV